MYTLETGHALVRSEAPAKSTPQEVRQAAEQFEALFVQGMLKQIRAGSGEGDELFGGSRMDMAHEMFDAEIARNLAEAGGLGLADMLVRQLGEARTVPLDTAIDRSAPLPVGVKPGAAPAPQAAAGRGHDPKPPDRVDAAGAPDRAMVRTSGFETPGAFAEALLPLAREAASRLKVPAEAIVAQSALETGWGRHMLRKDDGTPAWNLFGIKAGGNWNGDSVKAVTLEVHDGIAQRETARFRAYGSVVEAIEDYVRFLGENPRYTEVLDNPDAHSFARALQQSGYATDPEYAAKIERLARQLSEVPPPGSAQEIENPADV